MDRDGMSELRVHYLLEDTTVIRDFAGIFGTVSEDRITINLIQSATSNLKKQLETFVTQHSATAPHLQRLKKRIFDLDDNEFFLLLPKDIPSTSERFEYEQLLYKLNNPNEPSYEDEMRQTFDNVLNRYDLILPRTDRRMHVNTKPGEDRKCIFCGGTTQTGSSFKKSAHAISKAFGNDHLKLDDECDQCNSHFGDNVEPALIELLNIQRVFLGIQGRGSNNGRPEIQYGKDYIKHDGQQIIVGSKNISRDASGVLTARLGSGVKIKPAMCYRTLVKYAISVMPSDQLAKFHRTIKWLRFGLEHNDKLPTIATSVVPLPSSPSAQITVYIRKEQKSRLPHVVAEFRLGCYLYVYVLPFSEGDSWNLDNYFDDPEFRDTFRHYAQVTSWTHQNWSSDNEISIVPTIQMKPSSEFVQSPVFL